MKRFIGVLCCLITLCLMLPIAALAQTQEEWNRSCNFKASSSTTVYKTGTEDEVLETIPANTYVIITDTVGDDWQKIRYMISGSIRKGKVKTGSLVRCSSQVRGSDGLAHNVHELDPKHDEIVGSSPVILVAPSLLEEGNVDYTGVSFETPDSPLAQAVQQTAGRTSSGSSKSGAEGQTPTQSTSGADSTEVEVSVEEIGTHSTKVSYQGKQRVIPTTDLTFGEDVPDDKKVAYISAPRTGKATMRKSASDNGQVVKKCKAGTVVIVLKIGSKYTQINDGNNIGYVLTDCLKFSDPTAPAEGTAMLSYKGKTNGSTTINVRNSPNKDSAKVAVWKTGTDVVIMSHKDGWYEIEAKGIRGFVMEEFITVGE